jgi:hypothetical protein
MLVLLLRLLFGRLQLFLQALQLLLCWRPAAIPLALVLAQQQQRQQLLSSTCLAAEVLLLLVLQQLVLPLCHPLNSSSSSRHLECSRSLQYPLHLQAVVLPVVGLLFLHLQHSARLVQQQQQQRQLQRHRGQQQFSLHPFLLFTGMLAAAAAAATAPGGSSNSMLGSMQQGSSRVAATTCMEVSASGRRASECS